jgi:hypothetical protein
MLVAHFSIVLSFSLILSFCLKTKERMQPLLPKKVTTPIKLEYREGCLNQADATKREKYLKSSWGKPYIKNRLKYCLTG